MDHWRQCPRSGRGVALRRDQVDKQWGLRHERFNEALITRGSDYRFSESNYRGFFRRWAQHMATDG